VHVDVTATSEVQVAANFFYWRCIIGFLYHNQTEKLKTLGAIWHNSVEITYSNERQSRLFGEDAS